MKQTLTTLRPVDVPVRDLDDLNDIVRHNSELFAHHINLLQDQVKHDRKTTGIGLICCGLGLLVCYTQLNNVDEKLEECERKLGIHVIDEE